MSPQKPRTMILSRDLVFYELTQAGQTDDCGTYRLAGDEGSKGAVRHIVGGETGFESKSVVAPSVILLRADVLAELGNVKRVVPVDHILPVVVPSFVVGAQSRVAVRLNIVAVCRVVAADYVFDPVSVFEFQVVEVDEVFDHALAAVILSHQLDQLIHHALEVRICLVSDLAVSPEVHKQLHPFSLRQACLTEEGNEEESPRQILQLLIVQVDVERVLLRPIRQGENV